MQSRTVTGLVKTFFHEFDSEKIALAVVQKQSTPSSTKIECERDAKKVVREWDEARRLGTQMHEDIENFYKNGALKTTREFRLFLQFHQRVEQLGYVPLASEKKIYDSELHLAGVIDMLYIHKDNLRIRPSKVWLIDWKRSKEIKTTGFEGRCGFPPLDCLQDCNMEHYTMQMNTYKYMLERNDQYRVAMMSVVVLHPEQQVYSIHHCRERQDLVYKMLKSIGLQI